MNYHEALGRFTELSEQLAAEKTRRLALLNNLGGMAGHSSLLHAPVHYTALQALLDGAREADERIEEKRHELASVAAACNKSVPR